MPANLPEGYTWRRARPANVDVVSRDGAVIPWLFDRVLARATEFARAGGHATCLVDKGTYRDDSMMLTAANTAGSARRPCSTGCASTTRPRRLQPHRPV